MTNSKIGLVIIPCAITMGLAVAAPNVTLIGTAQNCHPGTPVRFVGVPGVNVSAFQVSKVPLLVSSLKEMDTTTIRNGAWPARLDSLMRQTDSMVNHSPALARVVSDSAGVFQLIIPATDSVLVYGLGHDEDDPVNQVYTTLSGRVDKSFILDMSAGGCGPVQSPGTAAAMERADKTSMTWGRRVLWFYAIIGLVGMSAMAFALWR